MLMAARQQTHDVGIMKALGFSDGAMSATLFAQSIALSVTGGALGMGLAALLPLIVADSQMQAFFPGVGLRAETFALGTAATATVGLIAGAVPAWRARRLRPVDALRAEG
jgi:putative ABC transport system permease protein